MRYEQFHFKQFSVRQDNASWKVGTDGILLGAWCDVSNAENVLDLGTGTGLLSLMIAQRTDSAVITSIEVDAESASVAHDNFEMSIWNGRLQAVCSDALIWAEACTQKFDLIVSNPPFFSEGLLSSDPKRKSARHGRNFGIQDVLRISNQLLENPGRLCLILPYGKVDACTDWGSEIGMYCARKIHIRHSDKSRWSRSILEFSRVKYANLDEDHLTLFRGDKASKEYKELIAAFRDA